MDAENGSTSSGIDVDMMTLNRFVLREQRKYPGATGDLTQLLNGLLTAVKQTSTSVRRAGVAQLFGIAGKVNVQGEDQKKLDVLANQCFINMMKSSFAVCAMVSEENENMIEVEAEYGGTTGKYIVCFDPLDGSSNIDCLVSIGSIISIYRRPEAKGPVGVKDILLSGRHIVAAGYALYGSATMFVLATRGGTVNGFMLDPSIGEFILTHPNIQMGHTGKLIYSINEANAGIFPEFVNLYTKSRKCKENRAGKAYTSRYIGSMVADVHRTLVYGGSFMYPQMSNAPNGKLRYLYEVAPMAFIVEAAGGATFDGRGGSLLDIQPESIHQRAPCYLGSKGEMEELLEFFKQTGGK